MTTTNDSGREPQGDWYGWLVLFAVLIRIFVGSSILNLFVPYDIPGGSPLVKITPGTYLLIAAAFLGVARPLRVMWTRVEPGVVLCGVAVVCVAAGVVSGNTAAIGFLIDSVFCAGCAAICLARLQAVERRRVFYWLLAFMCANALMLMVEFAIKSRFLPYPYIERVFRPAALLAHPLNNGLFYATMLPTIFLLRIPLWLRGVLGTFIIAAIFASGARVASLTSVPIFMVAFFIASSRETGRDESDQLLAVMQSLSILIVGALAAFVAAASGLGYRFSTSLIDMSSQSRVSIYTLLDYLHADEWVWGVGSKRMFFYAKTMLKLDAVESPIVAFIYGFGLPITLIFFVALLWALFGGYRRRVFLLNLSAVTFLVVSASNIVLATKVPAIVFAMTILFSASGLAAAATPASSPSPGRTRTGAARPARRA